MNFSIEILSVKVTTKPTSKGTTYQEVEVAYKDVSNGAVKSKKIMSFVDQAIFSTFAGAKAGDIFEIKAEKDVKGFWKWEEAKQGSPNVGRQANAGNSSIPVRNTYETPEERAKKQVYIIRQSSIASAVELHSVGSKNTPNIEDVLKTAQSFVDFVLGNNSPAQSFEEMNDDVPY